MKNSNVVLEIPSFQQEDAGGYECVAENKMGKNTVQGRLSFHGMIISLLVPLYSVHMVWLILALKITQILQNVTAVSCNKSVYSEFYKEIHANQVVFHCIVIYLIT